MLAKRLFLVPLLLLLSCGSRPPAENSGGIADAEFQELILELGETPGFFDTDNLISNESSYLHVVPLLEGLAPKGGAYLGVGPDQNFSYMAITRPSLALMVDVRRDNLLQHLYYKSIFEQAADRWQYLSILLGKPIPAESKKVPRTSGRELVQIFKGIRSDREFFDVQLESIWENLRERFPEVVQETDRDAIWHIAFSFFREHLDLKFRSHGRAPRAFYPSFGELISATDLNGQEHNYLASDSGYRVIKNLQEKNRVIPVVANLAGEIGLKQIGKFLKERGLSVSTFYVSNVEFYLFQDRSFRYFIRNLGDLPYQDNSVLIRSYFSYWRRPHPETAPGHAVTSLVQRIPSLLEAYSKDPFIGYRELLFQNYESNSTGQEKGMFR